LTAAGLLLGAIIEVRVLAAAETRAVLEGALEELDDEFKE
jgi:hypothetical protein